MTGPEARSVTGVSVYYNHGVDLINILAAGVTFISACLGVFFYLRSRRVKQLVFAYATTAIQTKTHPEVSIKFRESEITNLCRIRAVCWNAGRAAIRREDIPDSGWP